MISLTGLTKSESDALLPAFGKAEEYLRETDINDKKRKRVPGGGVNRNSGLSENGCSLSFFILRLTPSGRRPLSSSE